MKNLAILLTLFFVGCSNEETPSDIASITQENILAYTGPTPTPYPGPYPVPAPSPSGNLFEEINALRRSRGLSELKLNDALTCAAQKHAWDIGPRNVCSPRGSDGSNFIDRVRACQGVATAELIACNFMDARGAVNGWLQRMDAARILLHPYQVQLGVAEVDKHYVVVFLGMSNN